MIPLRSGPLPIQDEEFALFQALIHREAGISLGDHKKPLLVSRLTPRISSLGDRTFTEYYRRVAGPGGGAELVQMLDCICTNETHFFREPAQFDFLERTVIPAWIKAGPRPIRVWSAACSTGEEPYSTAMVLLHHLPALGFPMEILATDLSTRALARAEQAIFSMDRATEIPKAYLYSYMLRGKGPQEGKMKVSPEIRRLIRFRRHNLHANARLPGGFDLILCRNVLIYFDAATRAEVVSGLLGCLKVDGYLFLGHAESLTGCAARAQSVLPAIYRQMPGASARDLP